MPDNALVVAGRPAEKPPTLRLECGRCRLIPFGREQRDGLSQRSPVDQARVARCGEPAIGVGVLDGVPGDRARQIKPAVIERRHRGDEAAANGPAKPGERVSRRAVVAGRHRTVEGRLAAGAKQI